MRSARVLVLVSITSCAALGCGARTGLSEVARDASLPDAYVPDTGVPSPDAAPPCRVDADCDDGVACTSDICGREGCMHTTHDERCDDGMFCDGVERCGLGGCVAGTSPCVDGIDCTDDGCREERDQCVYTPDDARCPLSNTCDPLRGCEPRLLAQDPTSLYNIALPSGEVSLITRTFVPLTDVALAEDGTFYGATNGGGLVRVDARSGMTTPVLPVPGRFFGLEADPASTALYGGTDDRIVRFDLGSTAVVDVARLPTGEIVSGDLAFLGGQLLVTATRHFRVDPDDLFAIPMDASGPPTLVGNTGFPCIWGLAVYRDTLYGLTCHGEVLTIDPTTAATTVVSRTSVVFDGAAAR